MTARTAAIARTGVLLLLALAPVIAQAAAR